MTEHSLDEVVAELTAFETLSRGSERVLQAVLPCRDARLVPTDDLAILARDLDLLASTVRCAGVAFDRIALSPNCDLKSTPPGGTWPAAPSFAALAAAARAAFPGVAIGSGSFASITELNRKQPPIGLFDFIGHAIFPTVHAADDLSLTEGLEALPSILTSARAIIDGTTPYLLYPTALAMQHNPYGAAPVDNPRNIRVAMGRTDPRERGLFAACWYAGLTAYAARHGLDTLCLAAAAGPSAILANAADANGLTTTQAYYPSWQVLTDFARHSSQHVLASQSSSPRDLQVLAVTAHGRWTIWLTNLTSQRQKVRLQMPSEGYRQLAILDAQAVPHASRHRCWFDGTERPLHGNDIDLDGHAVARIVVSA